MAIQDTTPTTKFPGTDIEVGDWGARLFGIIVFFVGWSAIASVFPARLMPYPHQAIDLMWGLIQTGTVWPNLAATMSAMIWGFLGAMAMGIQMGVFMGIDDYQRKFMTPHVVLGLSIPHISWGITATLIFGFDILAPIVATILVAFPFVAVNVWKGVEDIDADLIEMSQSFDLSFRRMLRRVILPNTAPQLFSASRLGFALSWKTVTITEMFAASKGIGYKIIQNYQSIYFEEAWAWALVFMVVILVIEYAIFKPIQHRVFEYRQDADFDTIG